MNSLPDLTQCTILSEVRVVVRRSTGGNGHCWTGILNSLSRLPNLQQLVIEGFFDSSGDHALSVDLLVYFLRESPSLTSFSLDWVGIATPGNSNPFQKLHETLESHPTLSSITCDNLYFVEIAPARAWQLCTWFVAALLATPALRNLHVAPTSRFYSRPILSLDTMHRALLKPHLESLYLENCSVWGSGTASHCADALRQNTTLKTLVMKSCAMLGDDRGSILAGLDKNTSVVELDVAEMALAHADRVVLSLQQNTSLKRLTVSYARMGATEAQHHAAVNALIRVVGQHPSLTHVYMLGMYDYYRDNGKRPLDLLEQTFSEAIETVMRNRALLALATSDPEDTKLRLMQATVHKYIGLNRVKFWELCPAMSSNSEWIDAIEALPYRNLDCVFHILASNPLVMTGSSP